MENKPEINLKVFVEELIEYGRSINVEMTFNPYTFELIHIYGLTAAKKELLSDTLDLIIDEVLAASENVEDEEVDLALNRLGTYIEQLNAVSLVKKQVLH